MTPDAFKPVARVLDEGVPLVTMMGDFLEEEERTWPRESDPIFAKNCSDPDWEALRALDYEGEYLRLCTWLQKILSGYEFPEEVNGIFVQLLFPPPDDDETRVGLYLAGSTKFREEHDWAREAEIPGDDFIHYSETLTALYRNIARASCFAIAPRERAIYALLVFVSAVCAEWSKNFMRHVIRGSAPSRGIFIGLDPWMGFVIPAIESDRVGGHGSVVVSWSGRAEDTAKQAEVLSALREVAQWHEAQWNDVADGRSDGWQALAAMRGEPIPVERPLIRTWDRELTGRIFVSADVGGDEIDVLEEARRHRLEIAKVDVYGKKQELLLLHGLGVRGIDFRLFDPRSLSPSEDRFSFVFLESKEAPFLNGRLAAIDDREFTAKVYLPALQSADWFVQQPSVHLREYFEEWTAEFLAWLRFFHVPELRYAHREDPADEYEKFRPRFGVVRGRQGKEGARGYFFDFLKLGFEVEAERCKREFL